MTHFRCPHLVTVILLLASLAGGPALAGHQGATPESTISMMKKNMSLLTPELRQRIMALKPETRAALAGVMAQHTRYSTQLTMRQVMQEILSDYQGMITGIIMENSEQAADSARRLADHRIPRGGLLPYLEPGLVNDKTLSVLPAMNEMVEGNAIRLAEAADRGDLKAAAGYFSDITDGCMACHEIFRGQPGRSKALIKK
ncbi:MAG: hypothetical protein GY731_10560 [Gammaproteobacteria bacterium]|nr:hypothetical protein [Gammaproteobacteria bacterium]